MSVYRRAGTDHFWINVSVAGVKTRKSAGTTDRQQAEEFEHRERDRLWRLHRVGDRGATSFGSAAQRWLDETTKRTVAKDRAILDWFNGYLEHEPLTAIDRDAIEELRRIAISDGCAPATVDRRCALLRAVLRKAEREWRILDRAPAVPMFRMPAGEPRWLKPAEFAALKAELPEHLALAAEFAVLTLLRMRSMLALTWDRIDFKAKTLWVPAEQMKTGRTFGLPLAPRAVALLKSLRKLNPQGSHVFQWNGRPIDDCNTKAFQSAVERSKTGPLRWHDLRHTGASWAVQRGVSLHELMQLGGWSSYQMVLRYAHLAPGHLAKAAAKLGTIRAQRPRRKRVSH